MGRKLLTSPGVADTYTFLMNTWNTLQWSYQQKVYKNTFAAAKGDIQWGGEPHASSAHQPGSRECWQ
jgi:aminoglycoside phosphotransferase